MWCVVFFSPVAVFRVRPSSSPPPPHCLVSIGWRERARFIIGWRQIHSYLVVLFSFLEIKSHALHICSYEQKLIKQKYEQQGYGGGTGRLDDFYSYSFESDAGWERVEVLPESPRPGCRENNGVVIGDCSRMYLFGGYNGSTWLNDLWMFDIDTRAWTCIQESTATAAEGSGAVGGGPIVGGGGGGVVGADGSNLGIAVAGRVGQPTSSSPSSSEGPSRRFGYVSVVHNNKFVLFGGFDGARWLNDMFEFDLGTKTWKRIEARGTLPSMRSCPAWAKDDRYVYIHGVSLAFRSGVALFHFHAFHSYTPPPPHP